MAADIHLVFDVAGGGSLSGESGSLISSQLNSIINAINAKKFKIKVEIDAAHLNKQINQLLSKQLKATGIKTTAQNSGVSGAIKARAAELQTQRAMLSKMASEVSSAYSKVQKSMSIMGTGKQYAELQRLKLLMDDINRAKNTRGYNTTATMRDLDKRVASARQYVAALKEQEGAAKRAAAAEQKRATAEQKAKDEAEKRAKREQQDLIQRNNLQKQIAQSMSQVKQLQTWTAAKTGKSSADYAALDQYSARLKALQNNFNRFTTAKIRAELSAINKDIKISSNNMKAVGNNTKSLSDRLTGLAQKFSAWLGVSQVIMFGIRSIRSMISTSIELDDAFTQLDIVTHASEASMQSYANSIAESATKIGSSISDLVDSTTTYARLGYNLEESSKLAEFTAMLQNVGDIEVGDAQNAVTAIVKAFDVDVSDIESVMDKLVTTGRHNCPTA